ncbi:MAG TPA: pyruvate kinase [Chthoniobacterales bacterium]|nr:pyruvate kinase [Chthoniobacterales bacterium]
MRKTKIICTLGPASQDSEIIRQMIEAGTDVFRLNMSHAKHEWVRDIVPRVRAIAQQLERDVALLLDTQGPAIRTGVLKRDLPLAVGDILEITVRGAKSTAPNSITVNYDDLIDDVSVGDTVLVDNGVLQLRVVEKKKNRIRCTVLTAGRLGSRRHINLPGVHVNLPALTEKDHADVKLGAELGVDFVALSFARKAEDLEVLRRYLKKLGSSAAVVAKIEDQGAVRQIDDMIRASDIILVARGDLGIECPMEELPIIQRRIVKRCLRFGKPVVVATHMLESMVNNPVPTRAEITDVANAVFEQADAIMLTGETTSGRYPVECVKVLNRVALRIERSGGAGYGEEALLEDARQKTVAAAVELADSLARAKILVFTRHGTMARYVSNMRPEHAPIFAVTSTERVYRQLAICWGTFPVRIDFTDEPNATIEAAIKYLRSEKLIAPNDNLVIISDVRAGDALVDCVQLRTVGKRG